MTDIAVRVQNLSKKYKLYPSVQARFFEMIHPLRKLMHQEFWALKDVSFEVPAGKTYGIVGRNGSGKSTLLQLITGVLYPTLGGVCYEGKIAALLELGAGFNSEFTGRDNVIIQGTIQGFTKEEMEHLLPLIEEFADLGDFIHHPVKTYSSGMYVRLAFSAAIHVNPNILIVDEALAVGDAKFQAKCFRKFEQFRKEGKTVLLVTHDPNAVVRYCDTALLLDNGELIEIDHPRIVVNHYMELLNTGHLPKSVLPAQALSQQNPNTDTKEKDHAHPLPDARLKEIRHVGYHNDDNRYEGTPLGMFLQELHQEDRCPKRLSYNPNEHRYGDRRAEIVDYLIVCKDQYDPSNIVSQDEIVIYVKIKFNAHVDFPIYGVTIKSKDGIEIYGNNSWFEKTYVQPHPAGAVTIFQAQVRMNLTAGDYFINLGVAEKPEMGDPIALDRRYDLIHLHILQMNRCFGLVDFGARFCEYKNFNPSVSNDASS